MKKRKRSKRKTPAAPIRDDRRSQDDVLAIVSDVNTGNEYYMAFIDAFKMKGRDYVVMYHYEPDDGRHPDPEITIMQSKRHVDGEQYFLSIKNKKELDQAFECFFKRFEEAGGM